MHHIYRSLALFLLLLLPQLGLAGEPLFVTSQQIDLPRLLAAPPAVGSTRQQQEMAELLALQHTRTPDQIALAQADVQRTVFRFADVVGENFTPEKLPLTAALFAAVTKSGSAVVDPAKDFFDRPRPYATNPDIQPGVPKPSGASYPSGHSTFATATAIILADMLPEKRAQIFERAALYRFNRVLGGVHYPSDVEAGLIAGTAIAAFIMQNPEFQAQFARAKAETRQVLGLP